jgi:hypothetical protein
VSETSFRTERDSMGEMRVPASAYYGAQTARAVENFPISDLRFNRRFIAALGLIKFACAEVNHKQGVLDEARRAPLQRAAIVCLCILGLINFWFATLTWYQVHSTFESEVERHALANVPKTQRVYTLNEYPYNPGSTRMEWLGYHHDPRSIQQIASQKTNLPDWIYTTEGKLGFLDDARHIPGRAAMLNSEKGSPFDINQWHGLEGMGYHLERTIVPATPKWYPFNWMPAVQTWKSRKELLVYRLNNELAPGAPASR